MQLSMSVVGVRKGVMLTQVGTARAIGRGVMQQWQYRKVYVKMASTALIFSALQPVRPALHLPPAVQQHQQLVGPVGGRVTRGNHSSLLLFRQCASTDQSRGAAGSVLLETRECADGSIMYKFGSPDQKAALEKEEGNEDGQCSAQLSTESSDPNAELNEVLELPAEVASLEPVVIVNGVKHSNSRSPPTSTEAEAKDDDVELNYSLSDVNEKLSTLELEGLPSDPATTTNGIASPTEAPDKDLESAKTEKISDEVKKDETGKEGKPAYFNSGAAMIPHPEKAARGGEDAFFIEGTRWIGVADGVGGWANDGINAGLYARELMWNCAELARESEKDSDPKTVLIKGFSKTKAQGSTTAVVASISNQTLNVVNIGDSGFLVIRDGVLIDGSTPMVRGFNFPYQIGSEGDDPLLAEVYRVSVKKGDVIILASDGLFDNLFHDEIVAVVNSVVQAGSEPEVVAKKLASEAHKAGARNQGLTPFAKEAQRVGYNYFGGKMDDITAVCLFLDGKSCS